MIKLYSCAEKKYVKRHIDNDTQNPQSPFNKWGGWIGAKENKKGLYNVYYYVNFPKKTYNLHCYLKIIKG